MDQCCTALMHHKCTKFILKKGDIDPNEHGSLKHHLSSLNIEWLHSMRYEHILSSTSLKLDVLRLRPFPI